MTYPKLDNRLYIESFAVLWKTIEKSVNVPRESSSVGESFTHEKWFDEFPAVFPFLPIDRVNAFVRKWMCGFIVASHRSNGKILPVYCRHRLHILGFDGVNKATTEEVNQECFGPILVNPIEPNKKIVLFQGLRHTQGDIEAKERVQVGIHRNDATTQLLPLEVIVEKSISFLRNEKNNSNREGIGCPLPNAAHSIRL